MDAIEVIEKELQRKRAEEVGAKAVGDARVRLVLRKSGSAAAATFFAVLALRMKCTQDWNIDTACTDGKNIWYNPAFMAGLSDMECIGVMVHEVMHCSQKHMIRRGGREPKKWNVACDLAINCIIKDAGFKLPKDGCFPGVGPFKDLPPGLSAEEYYSMLPPSKEDDGQDPGGCGGVRDYKDGSPAQAAAMDAEINIRVAEAANAARQQQGKLPAELDRMINDVLTVKIPWAHVLREFITRRAKNDYSWSKPNKRHIASGLYLPSLYSEELGHVAIAIDTSGSICQEILEQFAGELNGILECHPCKVSLIYCDAQVHRVDTWEPSDGPLKLDPVGGGGTSHIPVFENIDAMEEKPECVICLTDCYTEYPEHAPDIPTLWACTTEQTAPFGQMLRIK